MPYFRVSKAVEQIDKKTGEVIAVFKNTHCAADSINEYARHQSIRNVCHEKPGCHSAYGYFWRYQLKKHRPK